MSSSHLPRPSLPTAHHRLVHPALSLSLSTPRPNTQNPLSSPTPLRLDRDDQLPRAEANANQLGPVPPEAPAAGFLEEAALARRRRVAVRRSWWFSIEYRRIGARASLPVSTTPRARGVETAPASLALFLITAVVEGSSYFCSPIVLCLAALRGTDGIILRLIAD